jgi:hypothetical protein
VSARRGAARNHAYSAPPIPRLLGGAGVASVFPLAISAVGLSCGIMFVRASAAVALSISCPYSAPQPVHLRQPRDDLVDLVADLLVALQRHHVGEAAARRHIQQRVRLPGIPVLPRLRSNPTP